MSGPYYEGKTVWAVCRHDVGPQPVVYVAGPGWLCAEERSEEAARDMVNHINTVCDERGWSVRAELLRARIVWEVVPDDGETNRRRLRELTASLDAADSAETRRNQDQGSFGGPSG
jgi:hypothetical protein